MEKLRKSFEVVLPPVELFLDDLQTLIDIANKLTPHGWHLETDDCKFNDIDDLKSNIRERTISSLKLQTDYPTQPDINLSISQWNVYVGIRESKANDLAAELTFKTLKEFLLSKKRHVPFLTRHARKLWWQAFVFTLLLIIIGLVDSRYYPVNGDLIMFSRLGLEFSMLILLVTAYFLWKSRPGRSISVIYMVKKPQPQTVFERMDAWINVKGQVSNLVGQVLKWGLAVGGGAALLYLYEHRHELF